ncbi:NS6 protein [Common moorhen coronavirus HKU21]|uniref:NS6 protein n=1 Tax=Common moorhen coronavirus HKU21 TaxID=1159902 RepID=H9BR38_9NIDO|nr:NS6 protein [Common moorhen coronavirus HKU21]AFD29247.1 NS6 protein [Common moorhen coronavirus HKU21]
MCRCHTELRFILTACTNGNYTDRTLYLDNFDVQVNCFINTLMVYISINPDSINVLPKSMLINGYYIVYKNGTYVREDYFTN